MQATFQLVAHQEKQTMTIDRNALWSKLPSGVLTTQIGSLPHSNIDSAIAYCFQTDIHTITQLEYAYTLFISLVVRLPVVSL